MYLSNCFIPLRFLVLLSGISVAQVAYEDVDRDILASVVQSLGGTKNPPIAVGAVVTRQNKRIKKTTRKPSERHVVSDEENSSREGEQIGLADELKGGPTHDKGKESEVALNLGEDEVTKIPPLTLNVVSRTSLSSAEVGLTLHVESFCSCPSFPKFL